MIRRAAALLAAGCLLAAPAAAAPAIGGPCSQGSCTWFRVLSREAVTPPGGGPLLRLRVLWWDSTGPRWRPARGARRETLFARCAPDAPAVLERRDGRWWERPLDPADPTPAGADRAAIALHAWACHGLRLGDGTSPALASLYPQRPVSPRMAHPVEAPLARLLARPVQSHPAHRENPHR